MGGGGGSVAVVPVPVPVPGGLDVAGKVAGTDVEGGGAIVKSAPGAPVVAVAVAEEAGGADVGGGADGEAGGAGG
ncbi:flagellar motor switch protein FliG, partial [Streptomyces sp. SID10815]|nr:flagellar motor switch protein FliG [Streptomyces sp. SID10815]